MEQRTLAIIKPDAVKAGNTGKIVSLIESNDLKVVAMKLIQLDLHQAEGFYHVHRERPFFGSLTAFMSEGPAVVMVLEGGNAISRWRDLMGATDPKAAEEGTIRDRFGSNIERNAVHGSDSQESADIEIGYFFSDLEIVIRD